MTQSKSAKLVRCKRCFRLLCKRVPVHVGQDESLILEIVHKGMTVYTYDAAVGCPICRSMYRINGNDGITEAQINTYDNRKPIS
ncbi:MAG: hypothetical protein LLF76_02785 [Planctomycetaceae bacterium]|nr:hypothetical protein [Planctomycetaceae bacterium]